MDDAKTQPVAITPAIRTAMDDCLLAGNHVASLTDGAVPYTASAADGLAHYGYGQAFDIWITWRGIMRLGDAWDAWLGEVAPAPTGGRPSGTD